MQLGRFGKIAISWAIITAVGVSAFVASKRSVDQQRYEHMKVRERIQHSNEGDYPKSSRRFT